MIRDDMNTEDNTTNTTIKENTQAVLARFGIEREGSKTPTEADDLDKTDISDSSYYEPSSSFIQEQNKVMVWGVGFNGGPEAINTKGRPKNVEKKNNKQLRMSAMLQLVRQLRPHLSKSVMAASRILDNPASKDADKLKAANFLVGMYKDALKDAYDARYDIEEGESINKQLDITPMFSLTVLPEEGSNE